MLIAICLEIMLKFNHFAVHFCLDSKDYFSLKVQAWWLTISLL